MADSGQKTEQPTQRRLDKAREEGRFPVSRDFVTAVQFVAAVGLLVRLAPDISRDARVAFREGIQVAFRTELTLPAVMRLAHRMVFPAMWRLLVALAALAALAAAIHLAVTRLGFSARKLTPDFSRLSPGKRITELPKQNIPALVQAILLLPLFAWAIWAVIEANLGSYFGLPLAGLEAGLATVAMSIEDLLWKSSALLLVFGSVDLFRKIRSHSNELRMSKQEVREELKDVEGNPQIKMRIRRLQRDLARRQMMKEVPKATAVIVNPTHYAVAIRYQVESRAAPVVVAKGQNYLAKRIRQKAIEHQVPIIENPPLAQALYKSVDVGQEIPAHLYRAVAEVLAYIFRIMGGRLPGAA